MTKESNSYAITGSSISSIMNKELETIWRESNRLKPASHGPMPWPLPDISGMGNTEATSSELDLGLNRYLLCEG